MPDRILIIALDLVNTPFLDQTRTRDQLVKYLSEVPADQNFALVAITAHGLLQIKNFGTSPSVLVEAVKQLKGNTSKDVAEQQQPLSLTSTSTFATECSTAQVLRVLNMAFNDPQIYGSYAQRRQAEATLSGLEEVAHAYAGVPGRKSVIWLTAGMPLLLYDALAGGARSGSALNADPGLLDQYESVFRSLNNANIAVYGVDIKGVHARQHERDPREIASAAYGPARTIDPRDSNEDDGIKALSAATGGKSCTSNSELKTCISQAVEDSSSYYLLGFYVSQQDRKPGWHKLDVKVTGDSGSVRARSSYYLAGSAAPSQKEINRNLRDAAASRIGYTGLAFSVEPQSAGGAPAAGSNSSMKILMPATSVLVTPGHPQLSYDIVSVPLDAKGDLATDLRVVHLNLSQQQTESALAKGWSFTETIPAMNAGAVKYLIRDNGTGRIGSVTVPLHTSAKGS